MLSDEQMSKRWPVSLLNDEQMSNWVAVKHLPDNPDMDPMGIGKADRLPSTSFQGRAVKLRGFITTLEQ